MIDHDDIFAKNKINGCCKKQLRSAALQLAF